LAFSPDSKTVASASYDRTVQLWDAATGGALQTLQGNTIDVTDLAFSPDGKTVASVSYGRTVRLWDAATGGALQTPDNCSPRELSFSRNDRGVFYLQFTSAGTFTSKPQRLRALFLRENWVTDGEQNLLWLPLDYRPVCSAFHGNCFVFGYHSGKVMFITFKSYWLGNKVNNLE